MSKRLKRQGIKRSMNETSPLLKEEEDALRKALYESLKDTKVITTPTEKPKPQKRCTKSTLSKQKTNESNRLHSNLIENRIGKLSCSLFKSKRQKKIEKYDDSDYSDDDDEPLSGMVMSKKTLMKKRNGNAYVSNQEEVESPSSAARPDRILQAQRKFAHSQPLSPYGLSGRQAATVSSTRPYTEDFVKYLCLRGTSFLPSELHSFSIPCLPPSPLSSDDEVDIDPQFAHGTFRPIQPDTDINQTETVVRDEENGEWLKLTDSGVIVLANTPTKASLKFGSASKKRTPKSKKQPVRRPSSAKRLKYDKDEEVTDKKSESNDKQLKRGKTQSMRRDKVKMKQSITGMSQSGEFASSVIMKPMESDFRSPVKYLSKCSGVLIGYGAGVIVPPDAWRPPSTIDDDIRINATVQHIHCLRNRVNPVTLALKCYQRHHERCSVLFDANSLPQIGGCEVDIVALASAVELFGGLEKVNSVKKWLKVADHLKLPKTAQGKAAKLQDIFIKYILPFHSLNNIERQSIVDEVNGDDSLELDPKSILAEVKSKPVSLVSFHRVSCNVQEMYADRLTDITELEANFWHVVNKGSKHVSVVHGEINVNHCGTSYHTSKSNKSDWSLPSLPLINGSGLKFLGPSHYLTVPVLKFSSIFTTSGWRKPPCGCHLIDYLHAGADKIWYAVPSICTAAFMDAMSAILSSKWQKDDCKNQTLIGSTLVSPQELMDKGCYVSRIVQKEGNFVILLPDVYYCCISTGYSCSEIVNYAPTSWLKDWLFKCEEKVINKLKIPLDKILLTAANEEMNRKWPTPLAADILNMLRKMQQKEHALLEELADWGVITKPSAHHQNSPGQRLKRGISSGDCIECAVCKSPCQLSHVFIEESGKTVCLRDALKMKSTASPDDLVIIATIQQTDLDATVAQLSDKLLHIENEDTA